MFNIVLLSGRVRLWPHRGFVNRAAPRLGHPAVCDCDQTATAACSGASASSVRHALACGEADWKAPPAVWPPPLEGKPTMGVPVYPLLITQACDVFASLSANEKRMRRHGTVKGLAHICGHAPEVVQQAGEYFRGQLRNVDVALRDRRTYLMGDQFATADILLTTFLTWAIDCGVGICDSAVPYLERTTARQAYAASEKTNCTV
ncbi:glutathione S-transferase C-terminal domain-containing protein [Bradyrhizobium ivorense]|uniref:glutathione S-transferase C-terminal domain-containing protein n=1 Tax=Bradyrhizobium ivorense TaxID=2511166 RepID=UPI001FCECE00|nr:glutathione S-transferase C-terminal domain-containing protein [Bradyrhizobium ivorense]